MFQAWEPNATVAAVLQSKKPFISPSTMPMEVKPPSIHSSNTSKYIANSVPNLTPSSKRTHPRPILPPRFAQALHTKKYNLTRDLCNTVTAGDAYSPDTQDAPCLVSRSIKSPRDVTVAVLDVVSEQSDCVFPRSIQPHRDNAIKTSTAYLNGCSIFYNNSIFKSRRVFYSDKDMGNPVIFPEFTAEHAAWCLDLLQKKHAEENEFFRLAGMVYR